MQPDIASTASLIGNSARSKMLMALLGGKALTATELSLHAEITPQTASSHLAKLINGELITVRKQGRHRYFQLKNPQVASLLENLLNISSAIAADSIATGPDDIQLRNARVCYDHLAGTLGVALYDSWVKQGWLIDQGAETIVTEQGKAWLEQKLKLQLPPSQKSSRPLCKSCLDWSERRNHLAGALGCTILEYILKKEWASKDLNSRAIIFNEKGLNQFKNHLNIL